MLKMFQKKWQNKTIRKIKEQIKLIRNLRTSLERFPWSPQDKARMTADIQRRRSSRMMIRNGTILSGLQSSATAAAAVAAAAVTVKTATAKMKAKKVQDHSRELFNVTLISARIKVVHLQMPKLRVADFTEFT